MVARLKAVTAQSATGLDNHLEATTKGGLFIDHGTGVVIGETAEVGGDVRMYQALTLGTCCFPVDKNARIIKGCLRHPVVQEDCVIYVGAILARITISSGSTIGGNEWLAQSVPSGSHITQAEFRHE